MKGPQLDLVGWPKLSEQLTGPRAPRRCQQCGESCSPPTWWEECDEEDRPSGVLVILCAGCAQRLIESHPRLYHRLDWPAPRPGAMDICAECRHRQELSCRHPDLRANGGAGLSISVPRPMTAMLCFGGGRGRTARLYPHEPRECVGREVAA